MVAKKEAEQNQESSDNHRAVFDQSQASSFCLSMLVEISLVNIEP